MKWLVQPFARSYGPHIQTNIHLTNYMIRKSLDIKNYKNILTINFVNIIFQTVKTAEITYYFSHIKTHKIHTHIHKNTLTHTKTQKYILFQKVWFIWKEKFYFPKLTLQICSKLIIGIKDGWITLQSTESSASQKYKTFTYL